MEAMTRSKIKKRKESASRHGKSWLLLWASVLRGLANRTSPATVYIPQQLGL